jgi:hypothetical protein
MEVTLPISATVDPAPARPITTQSPHATAPSVALPLRFMVTGLVALLAGAVWLVAQPGILATYHYNQHVIAVTHLWVLGWLGSIVMGAMYQLVPVALETRLYSERLARWHFALHLVGVVGMVWMFRVWDLKQVGHFGSVLAVGVGLFFYNIARTLRRAPRWNPTAGAIASALVWITLAVIAGLAIATAKAMVAASPSNAATGFTGALVQALQAVANFMARFDAISAMHAHAHLGGVGFFTLLIVGVSYKLVPMFTLSEVQSRRRAVGSIWLLNLGLAGSFVSVLLRSAWKPVFACIIVAALTLYAGELLAILRARKRRTLDWGIRQFLTAVALLGPLSLLGLALSWPGLPLNTFTGQLENLYGFVGLIGVVSFAVIGMLYKILPFLVWFACYSRQAGLARVPALADLYSERLQIAGYWTFVTGLLITGAGIVLADSAVVRPGCSLLAFSIVTLTANTVRMFTHFIRPQITPFASQPASTRGRS